MRSAEKAEALKSLPHASENLKIFQVVDLMVGDFRPAFQGCDFVIHTASPVVMTAPDPENDIIKPAVEGTLNVLRCAKDAGVKRVVVTASMASMCGSQREKNPDHVWNEADWNDAPGSPYSKSKVLAERAAWDYCAANGLELVTIHPSFVIGPITLARTDSFSIIFLLDLLNGKFKDTGIPPTTYGLVDIRDVSDAHIKAIEVPAAAGNRYIVGSKDQYSYFEWSQMVRKMYPAYPIPDYEQKPTTPRKNGTSNTKVQEHLGLKFTPLEMTLKDMVESAVEAGLATKL